MKNFDTVTVGLHCEQLQIYGTIEDYVYIKVPQTLLKGKYSSVFGQLNTGPFAQYMRWSIWIDLEEGEKEFTNGDIVFVIQDGRAATTIKCLEDGK